MQEETNPKASASDGYKSLVSTDVGIEDDIGLFGSINRVAQEREKREQPNNVNEAPVVK